MQAKPPKVAYRTAADQVIKRALLPLIPLKCVFCTHDKACRSN